MITTINKDILTVNKGVIVHSVNCIGGVGGLGGADWNIVEEIINKTFDSSHFNVYICKHE